MRLIAYACNPMAIENPYIDPYQVRYNRDLCFSSSPVGPEPHMFVDPSQVSGSLMDLSVLQDRLISESARYKLDAPLYTSNIYSSDQENEPLADMLQKRSCTHCKRASKRCDNTRPCSRCTRIGLADSCLPAIKRLTKPRKNS